MQSENCNSLQGQSFRIGSARANVLALLVFVFCLVALSWMWRSTPVTEQQIDEGRKIQPAGSAEMLVELGQDRQQHIWKCEHTTFELESKIGKRFIAAWKSRDRDALRQLLLPDFTGSTPADEPSVRLHPGAREERIGEAAKESSVPLTGEGLVEYLDAVIARFASIRVSNFKVLQIEETDPGQWQLRVRLLVDGAAPDGKSVAWVSEHAVTCRFNNDDELSSAAVIGAWDVLKSKTTFANRQLFREVTADVGLNKVLLPDNWMIKSGEPRQYHFQMAVDDFNLDGFPDIAVMTEDGVPFLLESDAGQQFLDRTALLGPATLSTPSSGVCWIDYDNDEDPDLLIGNLLFRNEDGKAFQEVTGESLLQLEQRPQGYTVVDYDCDGHLDVYVLYQHPYGPTLERKPPSHMGWIGDHSTGGENQLWRNTGKGTFRNVTRETLAGNGFHHSFAATWFFENDDRFPDVYIANDLGGNALLRSTGRGTFRDVTRETGTGDYATSMGVASGDLDNDGHSEIYVANMYSKMGRRIIGQLNAKDYPAGIYDQIKGSCAGNRLYRRKNDEDGFEDIGVESEVFAVGWAYAPAFADFDNDGRLDIYSTTGFLSFERGKPDG